MPLKVFSCCTYSTAFGPRTEPEWSALQFVRAIKGKPLRGYVDVPLPGGRHVRLDQSTVARAPEWFGDMVAAGVSWDGDATVALVPIPDSACSVASNAAPKTLSLAAALRDTLTPGQAGVFDLLRWAEAIPPAHLIGGTRDPQELYSLLRLRARDLPRLPPLVLIDDVLASGGHLRAAAAFLADRGAQVQMAICAGSAEIPPSPLEQPFASRTDVLADFVADPDWLLPFTSGCT